MSQIQIVALASLIPLLLVVVVLTIIEASFTRTSPVRAETLADDHPDRVARLLKLLETPESVLNPLRLLILAAQLTFVSLVVAAFASSVGALVLAGLVFVLVCALFVADVGSRTFGVLHADRVAVLLARPIAFLVAAPPVRLLAKALIGIGNVLVPGKGLSAGPFAMPEELIALADAAVEDDVLEQGERDLIESVIGFGDIVVREVMVPRTDMTTLDRTTSVATALEISSAAGYSRLPVVGENIDDVMGLVYVKDLIRAELDGQDQRLVAEILRPSRFVPETKRVAPLLREMQHHSFHMAVVVDEYGGVAGLVTLEDLIEEIVGEIVDEFDVEEPLVERQPDGSLTVDGRILITDLNQIADLELPEGDFDTVAGFVFDRFGRVPNEGEKVDSDGYTLRVERVQARRITKVHVLSHSQAGPDRTSQQTSP